MKNYMAIDQYGQVIHLGPQKYPRKALLTQLGAKSAQRMCVDGKGGEVYHCGYIVWDRWFSLYEVLPMRRKVR